MICSVFTYHKFVGELIDHDAVSICSNIHIYSGLLT